MAKKETDHSYENLKQEMKAGVIRPCYVFWGEEKYLLQHHLEALRKKVVEPFAEEFNFHQFSDETFTVDALWDSVENIPMMAERSMVLVQDIDLFELPEGDREKLITLLSDLPEYCTVVFTYTATEYKPDKRKKKLYEALTKSAMVVNFPRQTQRDLVSWIGRHFKSHKKVIPSNLCVYLMDITGGTMTALSGEIEKIAAYAQGPEIRKEDIDAVVEPVLDAVVFDMTDALGEGNYEKALSLLHTLFKMQQEPIAILGAVGAQLRRLSAARILSDSGKGGDELMRVCGMSDYPARKTMAAVKRFSAEFCRAAAELVLDTDYKMKTSFDDRERLLEMLLFQLAQEARRD